MIILYNQKTYYPDPAMANPRGMARAPSVGRRRLGPDRAKEDMTTPKPLTHNVISGTSKAARAGQ